MGNVTSLGRARVRATARLDLARLDLVCAYVPIISCKMG